MSDPITLPTGAELEAVRASVQALRVASRDPNWYTSPDRRFATPLEIAVAQADKEAHPKFASMCVGHSARTKLPCTGPRRLGTTACRVHGGNSKHVKRKARERLLTSMNMAIDTLRELSEQRDHLPTARAAAKDILDRVMPALRREEGKAKNAPALPAIQIGVVLGGVDKPQVIASPAPQKALPEVVVDGDVEEDE